MFLTTRDAYEPYYVDDRKYFELATFYDEFAKDWRDRRLPIREETRPEIQEAAVDVYRTWQQRNGGGARRPSFPTDNALSLTPRPQTKLLSTYARR